MKNSLAIKPGLSLWINSFLKKEYSKLLSLIREYVEHVEISIDYPWPYSREELLFSILDFIRDNNFYLGLHAPWRDIALASPYDEIGNASVNVIIDSLRKILEKHNDIKYLVIHVSTHQKNELINWFNEVISKIVMRIKKISSEISKYNDNIYLLIENLSSGISGNIDFLVKILETIDCENIGFCIDIGHLARYYNKYIAGSNYYSDYYDYLREVSNILRTVLGDKVLVVHLHDIDNDNEHLVIGEGFLNFKEIYRLLNIVKPEYAVYEIFRSKKKKLEIKELLRIVGAQKTWLKIYIH